MLNRRKNARINVYQLSSLHRILNPPIKCARLTLQEIELVSYADTAMGSPELSWNVNMNTGMIVFVNNYVHILSRTLLRIIAIFIYFALRASQEVVRGGYFIVASSAHFTGLVLQKFMRLTLALALRITIFFKRTCGYISRTSIDVLQILNPKPLIQKGSGITKRVAQYAGDSRQYLIENATTTIVVSVLVIVSSFMAYQTLIYYIAKII